MKKLLLSCMALAGAFCADAQDIAITNNSCQTVIVDINADIIPACHQSSQSVTYGIKPKTTLKLSMYAGGTYPQVNWSTSLPIYPGSQFTAIKVYDLTGTWVGYLFNPCWGSPSFTIPGTSCVINGTSAWSNPAFVTATLN